MISELRVRSLAVIEDVTLELAPGLNVLTGETGAGKSMLVDALALLLGERAAADAVRPGAERAVVEGVFDLGGLDAVRAAGAELGLDTAESVLVIRREVVAEGRSRAWVNGSPTTVGVLERLGRHLVDLHGQHETQSLLHAEAQREMLDAFAGAGEHRGGVEAAHREVRRLHADLSELEARRDDVRRRADYLRHVVREIDGAKPAPGEDERLESEHRRLAHAEELTGLADALARALDGGEADARTALAQGARVLDQLERLDPGVAPWRAWLDGLYANLDELAQAARAYAADIEQDPERLRAVEARRDLLFGLEQKYGSDLDAVLATRELAAAELDLLDTADHDLEALAERARAAERELAAAATRLSELRQAGAGRMEREVNRLLAPLGMPGGRLSVRLEPAASIQAHGAETVTFEVQLNPGLPPRPLARVASGGELSRLMLALKVVLVRHDAVPTLVFDEVDQGIGGEVGGQVGEALARVAAGRQVLVITHLPQIAARAARHVAVAKRARRGVAASDVRALEGEERVIELARMLGDADAGTARRHAEELLRTATPEAAATAGTRAARLNL